MIKEIIKCIKREKLNYEEKKALFLNTVYDNSNLDYQKLMEFIRKDRTSFLTEFVEKEMEKLRSLYVFVENDVEDDIKKKIELEKKRDKTINLILPIMRFRAITNHESISSIGRNFTFLINDITDSLHISNLPKKSLENTVKKIIETYNRFDQNERGFLASFQKAFFLFDQSIKISDFSNSYFKYSWSEKDCTKIMVFLYNLPDNSFFDLPGAMSRLDFIKKEIGNYNFDDIFKIENMALRRSAIEHIIDFIRDSNDSDVLNFFIDRGFDFSYEKYFKFHKEENLKSVINSVMVNENFEWLDILFNKNALDPQKEYPAFSDFPAPFVENDFTDIISTQGMIELEAIMLNISLNETEFNL